MKVLVTGSSGYVGSRLVPFLREYGHEVTTFDIRDGQDIRNEEQVLASLYGQDALVHLASISSDAACQKYEALAKSINVDAVEPMVLRAKDMGVRRLIYTSSAAVYGSTEEPAKENDPLRPTTIYANHKAKAEEVFERHGAVILRPAAVCGVSPNMRFDTPINMMTNHAIRKGVITVHGGKQRRPNLHIMDLLACINYMLSKESGTFNIGRQNFEVEGAAYMVACVLESLGMKQPTINFVPRIENRSYQIDSSKIRAIFKIAHGIEFAISDLYREFQKGRWPDSLDSKYLNVEQWATQK